MANVSNIAVILPAAGRGRRFGDAGGSKPKLEVDLAGKPVLLHAVELFTGRPEVGQVLVAVDPDQVDAFKFKWGDKLGFLGVTVVPGGKTERWETVLKAMEQVRADASHVAVHDAARPITDGRTIDRVLAAAATFDAVIPAVPVSSTLKRTESEPAAAGESEPDPLDAILGSAGKTAVPGHRVVETVSRENLWMVQTPQVFERGLLQRAYEQITSGRVETAQITDDAGLIESLGEPVHIVEGDPLNVKITVPEDVALAAAILALRSGRQAGEQLGPKRKFPTWAEMDEEQ